MSQLRLRARQKSNISTMGVGEKIKDAFRFEEDKKGGGEAPQGAGTEGNPLFVQKGDPSMGKYSIHKPVLSSRIDS